MPRRKQENNKPQTLENSQTFPTLTWTFEKNDSQIFFTAHFLKD